MAKTPPISVRIAVSERPIEPGEAEALRAAVNRAGARLMEIRQERLKAEGSATEVAATREAEADTRPAATRTGALSPSPTKTQGRTARQRHNKREVA